jgi:pSer/pThr/pTyr-binding forkhead associated (FHA) protein
MPRTVQRWSPQDGLINNRKRSEEMYKLLEIVEGNVTREHLLRENIFAIGRNPGNQLQPDNASVSGNHASLSLTPSPYLDGTMEVCVEDLDSTNGTLVNGKPVKKQLLKHGDMLALGSLNLKFIDEHALALGGTRIMLQENEV